MLTLTDEERRTLEGIDDMLKEVGHTILAAKHRALIARLTSVPAEHKIVPTVDEIAEIVYDAFPFLAGRESVDKKPAWVPGGNSHRQNDARRAASNILKLFQDAAPPVEAAQQGWRTIDSAPKDGTEIIYWNIGQFVSSCEWRDADEGRAEGWWDDAITEFVEPQVYLMPLPAPPGAST